MRSGAVILKKWGAYVNAGQLDITMRMLSADISMVKVANAGSAALAKGAGFELLASSAMSTFTSVHKTVAMAETYDMLSTKNGRVCPEIA